MQNSFQIFFFTILYIFSTNISASNSNQSAVATAHEIATRTGIEILKEIQ